MVGGDILNRHVQSSASTSRTIFLRAEKCMQGMLGVNVNTPLFTSRATLEKRGKFGGNNRHGKANEETKITD